MLFLLRSQVSKSNTSYLSLSFFLPKPNHPFIYISQTSSQGKARQTASIEAKMHEVVVSALFPGHASCSVSEYDGEVCEELGAKEPAFLDEDRRGENDDDDFSFVCMHPDGSPISADDAFVNGQIRSAFPMFDQRLLFSDTKDDGFKQKETTSIRPRLKKLFFEEDYPLKSSSASEGEDLTRTSPETYCEWSPRKAGEASPELRKKSYSTGFSKLWRFRDIIHRSNSDGKDAYVFLRSPSAGSTKDGKEKTEESGKNDENKMKFAGVKGKGEKGLKVTKRETASSVHERHYTRNRAENEMNKRKSYLPYRKNLMGFFTSVNGLSRSLHPY